MFQVGALPFAFVLQKLLRSILSCIKRKQPFASIDWDRGEEEEVSSLVATQDKEVEVDDMEEDTLWWMSLLLRIRSPNTIARCRPIN